MSHLPPLYREVSHPKFGSEKVSRYTGVSQLQLRVSRYTVQLSLSLSLSLALALSLFALLSALRPALCSWVCPLAKGCLMNMSRGDTASCFRLDCSCLLEPKWMRESEEHIDSFDINSLAPPHKAPMLVGPSESSRNKLPFMILNPPKQTAKKGFSCRKMHFPTENCFFPAEKCIFLQKNALSRRKMRLSGAHGRKLQEIAGGFQGSRIKNASQLSKDRNKFMCLIYWETNVKINLHKPDRGCFQRKMGGCPSY